MFNPEENWRKKIYVYEKKFVFTIRENFKQHTFKSRSMFFFYKLFVKAYSNSSNRYLKSSSNNNNNNRNWKAHFEECLITCSVHIYTYKRMHIVYNTQAYYIRCLWSEIYIWKKKTTIREFLCCFHIFFLLFFFTTSNALVWHVWNIFAYLSVSISLTVCCVCHLASLFFFLHYYCRSFVGLTNNLLWQ